MTNKIRWGVIGSGGIARRRTIPEGIVSAKNADLSVVFDIDPDANKAVADEFHARPVSSMKELLSTNIDAVYIATPAHVHCRHVLDSAKAGKHILCEKPLGLTVDEAESMRNACKSEGVLLGIAMMMRFQSQHQTALAMVREGAIGKLVYGRAQLSCWYPIMDNAWRQDPVLGGGGSLIDMGGHCIDLLEMFFGRITKVSCMVNNSVHSYVSEDSAVVIMSFEIGAMASVDTYFCIPDESSKNRLELYGSKGSILAQNTIGQGEAGEMIAYLQEENSDYDARQKRTDHGGIAISPKPVNMYRAEIEDFSNAVLENREPLIHAQLGIHNQQILAACYESARTGSTITV